VSVAGLIARAAAASQLVDGRIAVGGSFAALNIGYLGNNLLPLRAGEAIRSVLVGRRSGLGVVGGAAAVATERVLDVLFAASILLAALPVVGVGMERTPVLPAAVIAACSIAGLMVAARNRHRLVGWLEPRLAGRPRIARWLPRLAASLDGFARPRRLLAAAGWLAVSWALAVLFFWLVLRAFLPAAPLGWAAFGIGVLAFGIALPSSPGAVGVYEAAWVGALALCGVASTAALAFAVAAHAITFGLTSAFGVAALLRRAPDGRGVADRLRRLLGTRDLPAPEEAAQ
ncbi:MAG: lysylphosphatidylglycerol synthase transmembrane domain-containing protein, partial [Holophagae bacterium]